MGDFYKAHEITGARFYFLTLACFFLNPRMYITRALLSNIRHFVKPHVGALSHWEKMSPVSKICAIR